MRKYLFALLVLVAAGTTLLVAAFAVAGGGSHNISAQDGLDRVPGEPRDSSTTGSGSFEAKVNNDDSSFDWTLSYGGLEGAVTQSHIHFGQQRDQRRHLDLAVQDRGDRCECSAWHAGLSDARRNAQRHRRRQ